MVGMGRGPWPTEIMEKVKVLEGSGSNMIIEFGLSKENIVVSQ